MKGTPKMPRLPPGAAGGALCCNTGLAGHEPRQISLFQPWQTAEQGFPQPGCGNRTSHEVRIVGLQPQVRVQQPGRETIW